MTALPGSGTVAEGTLLFEPSPGRIASSTLTRYLNFLHAKGQATGIEPGPAGYEQLWQWSVDDLSGFWSSVAAFAEIPFRSAPSSPLGVLDAARREDGRPSAEGARWFAGTTLNYADVALRHDPRRLAVISLDEAGRRETLTYGELATLVQEIATSLSGLGVGTGDRVAAVLGNGVEAIGAFLATASLGAIWSSCAPEFGAASMLDRFRQIDPKVLVASGSYRYGGKEFDLSAKLSALGEALQSTIVTSVAALRDRARGAGPPPPSEPVDASHPLWILYSSGTTGLPKAIVHSHGGIVLEHAKALALHGDIGPGERFFWFSTTGWMMWNYLVGGLLVGATIVAYDGSPVHPDPLALWRMAAREQVSFFGTSAPYLEACRKQGLSPRSERGLDLSCVRSIGSTGAPLPPEGFAWASAEIGDDVLVASVSGGTDLCTAFLTSCPWLPVHAGELQCAALGAHVEAYGEGGVPVVGEVGELVLTSPMPSMPVGLFGDEDGTRLHEAYFANYRGVWRHGDWVKRTERGSYVVYGRSDATLNRGGVRMGTAEFYRVVETLPEVADSLVVDTSELGRDGELVLLVVPAEGASVEGLELAVKSALREHVSPRHVPDRVIAVAALPRTLNGKKVEVPVRRILLGTPVGEAVAHDALADPKALEAVLERLRSAGLL